MDADTDCAGVKRQSPVEEQLEPLVILEDGDELDDFTTHISTRGKGISRVKNMEEDSDRIKGCSEGTNDAQDGHTTHQEIEIRVEKEESKPEEDSKNKNREVKQVMGTENENLSEETLEDSTVQIEGRKGAEVVGGSNSDTVVKETPGVEIQPPVQLRPKDLLKPLDAHQKIHRLSSDSPDALYELLCSLQEGRRLNDQRCSFTLQPRRRCYSVPSTPQPGQKVVFSSMTSLQKEEFFDLVATSQARRLDDQRANFQKPPPVFSPPEPRRPSSAPAGIPAVHPSRTRSRRSSWKQVLDFGQTVPKPAAREELYTMILNSQAQGRLEEQRSKAPGPMDDEDFFSLLLKVQGGRMDEQRTELPVALRY
ncbi:G-protein-signaling modulator 2 [Trichomycterus rosablanca]|uniref:G-protein-signaling modulator 2 n=1 Tax=Trichomycterus rosablanca TaxID=2290929 RepID=UPI002F35989B